MKKLALALTMIFVVCSLVFIGSLKFGITQTGTSVTGIIFSDQTWTAASSPYNLIGPTAVFQGVTVTIQPGVTVDFNIFTLQVNGTLSAIGTSANPITLNGGYSPRLPVFASEAQNGRLVFTSVSSGWNSQTGNGSIIQCANIISLTVSTSVTLKIDSNSFSGAYADDAVDSDAGSSTITNNVVNGSTLGISGGTPVVFNNTIEGFIAGGGEGLSINGGSPQILNNVFFLGYTGIYIDGAQNVTVDNNIIANYTSGLYIYSYSNLTYQGNLMLYDTDALLFSGFEPSSTTIDDNTIAYSADALYYLPAPATVNYNNLENNQVNIYLASSTNINASNNWWGTTNTTAISQSIYDYKNNYNLGNVTFTPFLNAPNSQAPSTISFSLTNTLPVVTQAPTPTPATTSSSAPSNPPTTNPTASPTQTSQPSQTTPSATPQPTAGSSVLTQNQLYDLIAVLAAVTIELTIALAIAIRHKKTMMERSSFQVLVG